MTDQTIPNVTDDDRRLAREWAAFITSEVPGVSNLCVRAAARVILDAVPAPPPKRPTLADVSGPDREACRWMQADLKDHPGRYVIVAPYDEDDDAGLISADGGIAWVPLGYVTPRPDLPRMEWPADKATEDVAPVKVGDVIESAADPRIPALPVGSVLIDRDRETVAKRSEAWAGLGYIPIESEGDEFGPWKVLHIPKEADQ